MAEKQEIIRLKIDFLDPKGYLLPRGVRVKLTAEIADEVAVFSFDKPQFMKKFATVIIALEKKRNATDTKYIERMQKTITQYPGKKKEEIRDILLEQFRQLGAKGREDVKRR